MKNTIIILSLIFPLLGSSTKKPIDVSIVLSEISERDTENLSILSYWQNTFAEGWCDFYQDSETGEYYLHEANIEVGRDYDDCREDTVSWAVSDRAYSLFVIKGLKPKKKPVKSLALQPNELLSVKVGETYSFRFGRKTYTLRAEGTVIDERDKDYYEGWYWDNVKDYKLFLSDGKNEQLITTVSHFQNTSPDILWVGDLDDDGKPDFLVCTATWYENERIELYLSSIAGKDELVKLADTAGFIRDC
jgi:hypothetical protein